MELPAEYLARMRLALGDAYGAYLAEMERPPRRALRVNTIKIAPHALSALLSCALTPIGSLPAGFFVPEGFAPGKSPLHAAGLFYMQEPSAQLPAAALAPAPGETVLDLCAAPGGKSTQLAARMENAGLLICNEPVSARAQTLLGNLERMGARNAVTLSMRPEALAGALPGFFDAILADAPCSGEGMFRREPAAARDWSPRLVRACASRQRGILASAARMLRPGGRLVYSTCTFSPEEDEETVDWFLAEHPDFSLLDMQKRYPHKGPGEGQFYALLSRAGSACAEGANGPRERPRAERAAREAFAAFWSANMNGPLPENALFLPDGRVLLPPCALPDALARMRVLRAGVQAGELREGRFIPAHGLYMAYPADAYAQRVALPEDEAARFLAGEALRCEASLSGWCAVLFQGYPIGFGKAVSGTLKNHLPKGLRVRGV